MVLFSSPLVYKNINDYLSNGHLNYYPIAHSIDLINKLSEYTGVDGENITYFASSDAAHEYILRAFSDTGKRLLIVGPTYDNFRVVAQSCGLQIDTFQLT